MKTVEQIGFLERLGQETNRPRPHGRVSCRFVRECRHEHDHGHRFLRQPLQNIETRDALIDWSDVLGEHGPDGEIVLGNSTGSKWSGTCKAIASVADEGKFS